MGLKTCASLLCFALYNMRAPLRAIVVAVPPSLACLLHLHSLRFVQHACSTSCNCCRGSSLARLPSSLAHADNPWPSYITNISWWSATWFYFLYLFSFWFASCHYLHALFPVALFSLCFLFFIFLLLRYCSLNCPSFFLSSEMAQRNLGWWWYRMMVWATLIRLITTIIVCSSS